ncbi:hypothetical protein FRB99_001451 [Tulasnella sp. 403]|nr:hypothetical protein FRB99_001451 [Tulasnella sp. 403]
MGRDASNPSFVNQMFGKATKPTISDINSRKRKDIGSGRTGTSPDARPAKLPKLQSSSSSSSRPHPLPPKPNVGRSFIGYRNGPGAASSSDPVDVDNGRRFRDAPSSRSVSGATHRMSGSSKPGQPRSKVVHSSTGDVRPMVQRRQVTANSRPAPAPSKRAKDVIVISSDEDDVPAKPTAPRTSLPGGWIAIDDDDEVYIMGEPPAGHTSAPKPPRPSAVSSESGTGGSRSVSSASSGVNRENVNAAGPSSKPKISVISTQQKSPRKSIKLGLHSPSTPSKSAKPTLAESIGSLGITSDPETSDPKPPLTSVSKTASSSGNADLPVVKPSRPLFHPSESPSDLNIDELTDKIHQLTPPSTAVTEEVARPSEAITSTRARARFQRARKSTNASKPTKTLVEQELTVHQDQVTVLVEASSPADISKGSSRVSLTTVVEKQSIAKASSSSAVVSSSGTYEAQKPVTNGVVVISLKQKTLAMGRPWYNPFDSEKLLAIPLDSRVPDMMNRVSEEFLSHLQRRSVFESMINNENELDRNAPPITIVNEVDDTPCPPFEFMWTHDILYGKDVPRKDRNVKGCGCVGPCDPQDRKCACVLRQEFYLKNMGEGFAYAESGSIQYLSTPVFECNDACSCTDDCMNRVVQKGRQVKLSIRKTRYKGWGVFTEQKVPYGTFIGVYSGELITDEEANTRGAIYERVGRTYLFAIDYAYLNDDSDLTTSLPHETDATPETNARTYKQYTVDAFHAGNHTRFLNHSCSPNVELHPIYIDDADLSKPLLCAFTIKDVMKGEELCFSYHGREDDELNIAPKPDGESKCRCGAVNCKGYMFNADVADDDQEDENENENEND